jgi:glyoxylase-like metal-dependent hydrolase (beta-lactamase superfamily II)
VLLYRERFLFTGDHLWWNPDQQALGASRSYCWYSWSQQIHSMERLLDYSFEWVLPGHGDRIHLEASVMRAALMALIDRMKRQAA